MQRQIHTTTSPWVYCKLPRGGRKGITPGQRYLTCRSGLGTSIQTPSFIHQYHPSKVHLCGDGKQIFIVESKKAGLGIPHLEVTFILQGTESGVKQLEKQQEGNSAWVKQSQKFNPPSTEKDKPPPNPVFQPWSQQSRRIAGKDHYKQRVTGFS